MMRLKFVAEKSGRKRTTPEACKVASAMAKIFTFASHLSHLQRLRSSKKPSPAQNSEPTLPLADATIRAFFHEQCRSWKQWLRSSFAITRCDKTRSKRGI